MAKCSAGDCDVECGGGKGCGCIAESDNPEICSCICTGGDNRITDFKLAATTLVDVSMDELPLFDAAQFLGALAAERVVIPAGRKNHPLSLAWKRKPFGEVLTQLGLGTEERIEADKRRTGILTFLAGLAVGGFIIGVMFLPRQD